MIKVDSVYMVDHDVEILFDGAFEQLIETAGRTCYKSEDKITPDSNIKFIQMLKRKGHFSVIEHSLLTVKFTTNRGITHELVRHRLCAFSQESTRYVNYSKKGYTIIRLVDFAEKLPVNKIYKREELCETDDPLINAYHYPIFVALDKYEKLLSLGMTPQKARDVLPHAIKAEIVVSTNFREWMHILDLRLSENAHPAMRYLMAKLAKLLVVRHETIFGAVSYTHLTLPTN